MKLQRMCIALLFALCAGITFAQQSSNDSLDETAVWKLEYSYWDDVKSLDLVSYRALWHADFIGWPFVSPTPLHKDHVTDWIDHYTAKGLHLRSYSLRPAASHATGNIVVTYYWLTATWQDKNGHGEPQTSRITHTWLKTPATPTGWQILGGMSAAEPPATPPEPKN
ncbi:MAG TPA: nuclear transport factor 2 family protein [Edaphobacter sp.]|nr:nuclear transport factor 2 family protein [Edaphobacter sp.]